MARRARGGQKGKRAPDINKGLTPTRAGMYRVTNFRFRSDQGEFMKSIAKVSVAAVCALGMSAAMADEAKKEVAKEQTRHIVAQASGAPVQVAQAGAAGGAAGGASAGGVAGGIGVAGTVGSTVVFVGSAVAGFAAASDGTTSTTSH